MDKQAEVVIEGPVPYVGDVHGGVYFGSCSLGDYNTGKTVTPHQARRRVLDHIRDKHEEGK